MNTTPQRGYMYLTKGSPFFAKAVVGEELRIAERSPPWLTVCALERVLYPGWPGEFLLAEVVDPISEAEQKPYGGAPAAWAGYTRAAAVRVLEKYHLPHIFGQEGDAVAAIVDAAAALSKADADEMVERRHPDADEARARVEGLIRSELDRNGSGQAAPFARGSPLGAMHFLHHVVSDRAIALVGDRAFDDDPDDPEGTWLAEPWMSAVMVLSDAALAIGAPHIVVGDDRAILLQGSQEFRSSA